jgi:ectoine hydroxylase-related dioxygenase (phytanoyl-CoA dioxygenase family)
MSPKTHQATPEELAKLHGEGYFIRERFFSPNELNAVEEAANRAVDFHNQKPRDPQDMYSAVSCQDGIIFVNEFMDNSGEAEELLRFSLQPRVAEFARSVAGPRAAHHCYQLVYKFPQYHNPFPWHQDHNHTPANQNFYNMWIALSDMTIANGCLRVLPKVGLDTLLHYQDTPFGKTCWSLDNPDQGTPMEMERGSIFMITSRTLHSSGGNYTDNLRKAMLLAFIDGEATVFGKPVRLRHYH